MRSGIHVQCKLAMKTAGDIGHECVTLLLLLPALENYLVSFLQSGQITKRHVANWAIRVQEQGINDIIKGLMRNTPKKSTVHAHLTCRNSLCQV
jgi:hypothetical protein